MNLDGDIVKLFLEATEAGSLPKLEQNVLDDKAMEQDLKLLKDIWTESSQVKDYQEFDTSLAWAKVNEELGAAVVQMQPRAQSKRVQIWSYVAVAASMALLIMAAIYFLDQDEELYVEVSTENEWREIKLEDGTEVQLLSNSYLRYPKTFEGMQERRIWLRGDAIVAVAAEANRDFVTENYGAGVLALGTEYQITSDSTDTAGLLSELENKSGSMRMYQEANPSNQVVLDKPGQKAVFTGGPIEFIPVELPPPDTPGVFITIETLIDELQVLYPKQFVTGAYMNPNLDAFIKVDRTQGLRAMMAQLDSTAIVEYFDDGTKITLQHIEALR